MGIWTFESLICIHLIVWWIGVDAFSYEGELHVLKETSFSLFLESNESFRIFSLVLQDEIKL